jgi:putative Mg2+ transporter-C (MgtC) family protein
MSALDFALDIGAAVLLGVAIGVERQFRRHPAGLRTNALVCLGAALFVSLSGLLNDSGSPTRMASYVVSGIGFLGGGVILREGFNVRGMNTAATLWCTAAVGSLCGSGFPLLALIGTAAVLSLHLGLRPLARWIDARARASPDVDTAYRLRVVCPDAQNAVIRTILMRHANSHPGMFVQGISTQDTEEPGRTAVVADIFSIVRNDRKMEELVSRLNIEPGVTSVHWERVER